MWLCVFSMLTSLYWSRGLSKFFYLCIFFPHLVCSITFRWFGFMFMYSVCLSHCLLIYTGFIKWKPNRKKETTFSKWKRCLRRRSNGLQWHGLLEQNQRKLIRWLPWNLLAFCCICCGLAWALLSFSFFSLMEITFLSQYWKEKVEL